MATKKRTVRLLFSIDVDIPSDAPNTLVEGPGPWLEGFLGNDVSDKLASAVGFIPDEWHWTYGAFRLHAVEEVK